MGQGEVGRSGPRVGSVVASHAKSYPSPWAQSTCPSQSSHRSELSHCLCWSLPQFKGTNFSFQYEQSTHWMQCRLHCASAWGWKEQDWAAYSFIFCIPIDLSIIYFLHHQLTEKHHDTEGNVQYMELLSSLQQAIPFAAMQQFIGLSLQTFACNIQLGLKTPDYSSINRKAEII